MKKFLKIWETNKITITALVLFVAAFALLNINSAKPFYGEHDWNGVRYGNIARNYLKYGLWETKFGQLESSGFITNPQFKYFTHYPPTLPLLLALSFSLFGISEWSARLIPILATSTTVVLIFLIGNKIANFKTGLLSALLALATPLVLYFGKTPVHEPLVVCFALVAYFSYLQFKENKKILFKILFILGLILAQLTTWTGFFLIPAMVIVAILKRDTQEVKNLVPYLGLSIAIFLSYIGFVYFLTGAFFGGDLIGVMLQRSAVSQPGHIDNLNLLTYLGRLRLWMSNLYTITLLILVSVWILNKKFHKLTNADWVIITLGIFGSTYLIFFPNATYIHNYLVFYLLPFMALAGGMAVTRLAQLKMFKKHSLILCLVLPLLVVVEKINLLQALNQSNADKFAVEVGRDIRLKTQPNDIVLISPQKFGDAADNFLKFYSDRRIIYSQDVTLVPTIKVVVDRTNQSFQITNLK